MDHPKSDGAQHLCVRDQATACRLLHRVARLSVATSLAGLLMACGGGGSELGAVSNPAQTDLLSGPLEPRQWHLRSLAEGGINVLPYRDHRYTGEGIKIAQFDTAIQVDHPDLRDRVVDQWDWLDGDASVSPIDGDSWHGTVVAGLMVASANEVGVRGVAPLASLLAYRVVPEVTVNSPASLGTIINRVVSEGAAIVNNSWTSADEGGLIPPDSDWKAALDANGVGLSKGPVIVFSAGNNAPTSMSSMDPYVADYRVITVGAVTQSGAAASYSEPGANVLISAPGGWDSSGDWGFVSTDIVGPNGVVDGDYTTPETIFGGTSFAAPLVSGVIAQMLQANPSLTPRDVSWILAKTAKAVSCPSAISDCSGWLAAQPSAPGFPVYSHKYGFGRVDATAAVLMAETFGGLGGGQVCDLGEHYGNVVGMTSAPIPDGNGALTVQVDAACDITVDRVQVEVKIARQAGTPAGRYSGDLALRLTSPGGLVSELLRPTPDCAWDASCLDISQGYVLSSVRHLGESATAGQSLGTWRLTVADERAGYASSLVSWRLIIHGH